MMKFFLLSAFALGVYFNVLIKAGMHPRHMSGSAQIIWVLIPIVLKNALLGSFI